MEAGADPSKSADPPIDRYVALGKKFNVLKPVSSSVIWQSDSNPRRVVVRSQVICYKSA